MYVPSYLLRYPGTVFFCFFFLLLFNCLPYLVNKDEYNNGCQDALILLRSSFSAPMVLHLCAVPPQFLTPL